MYMFINVKLHINAQKQDINVKLYYHQYEFSRNFNAYSYYVYFTWLNTTLHYILTKQMYMIPKNKITFVPKS